MEYVINIVMMILFGVFVLTPAILMIGCTLDAQGRTAGSAVIVLLIIAIVLSLLGFVMIFHAPVEVNVVYALALGAFEIFLYKKVSDIGGD